MRVAIYARFSTENQDASSIEQQLHRCREYASKRGHVVVAEYSDYAVSGRTLDRPEMQRMLRDAKTRPFTVILVDDLSRLSRDMADTLNLVFRDLMLLDIQIIDVTTGVSSDSPGSRMLIGTYALVNDAFLQSVKAQTHRGLADRARGGFATGGRVYGYRTVTEPAPADPEHPRKIIEVEPLQAEVVRRIFDLYVSGTGLVAIAKKLNAESVPAPFDGERSKKQIPGWAGSTIRAILHNPKYVGRWEWNRRKWLSISGMKVRRPKLRPQDELVVREFPERAIISKETWEAATARFRHQAAAHPGRQPTSNILSGLLRCGTCGGNLAAVGIRKKNGRRYVSYGCAVNKQKGNAVCTNSFAVSELQVLHFIEKTALKIASSPTFAPAFERGFVETRAASRSAEADRGLADAFDAQQKRVDRLVDAIADAGGSAALTARLKEEEAKLQGLQARLRASSRPEKAKTGTGPADAAALLLRRLAALLATNPEVARSFMVALMEPLTLTHGFQDGVSIFDGILKIKIPANQEVSREVLDKMSCGGAQDGFSPTEKALYTRRINAAGACSFPGCTHPLHGAGLCDAHRNQLRRGLPLTPLRPPRRKPSAA